MSSHITAASALGLAKQHYRQLGIDLPPALLSELDQIDATTTAARDRLTFDAGELAAAVEAALDAGKDPAADKAVAIMLARQQLATPAVLGAVRQAGDHRKAQALRRHAPAVIEQLAEVVDRADAVLVRAREEIPALDLGDPQSIHLVKPELMSLWGAAREAQSHVETAETLWFLVVSATRSASLSQQTKALIVADLSAADLDALRPAPTAVPAVIAGHRLSLATPEVYTARVERVERERLEAEVEAEQRRNHPQRTPGKPIIVLDTGY